jgi:hypothetical protein
MTRANLHLAETHRLAIAEKTSAKPIGYEFEGVGESMAEALAEIWCALADLDSRVGSPVAEKKAEDKAAVLEEETDASSKPDPIPAPGAAQKL